LCHAVTTGGKARGEKDSQKVGSDYHFVLGPLFWECPPPTLGLGPTTTHMEKKLKNVHLQKFQIFANFQP